MYETGGPVLLPALQPCGSGATPYRLVGPTDVEVAAQAALAMRDAIAEIRWPSGDPMRVRIGMATGPAVAGVIGQRKFAYDLWGDTVNTAARLESNGVQGEIQVSEGRLPAARRPLRVLRRARREPQGEGSDGSAIPHREERHGVAITPRSGRGGCRPRGRRSPCLRREPCPRLSPLPSSRPRRVRRRRSPLRG